MDITYIAPKSPFPLNSTWRISFEWDELSILIFDAHQGGKSALIIIPAI
jgi:hypothetical protein